MKGTPGRLATGTAFVLLRYILIAATVYLIMVEGQFAMPPNGVLVLIAAALVSNLIMTVRPASEAWRPWLRNAVILGDTVWITVALLWSGRFGSDFIYIYFFVLLLAAIGENLSLIAVGAVIVCAGYGYVMSVNGEQWSLWNSPSIIRLPFLFTAAAFYGYLVESVRQEQRDALTTGAAVSAKLDLLATVTHEIRTPMTAILGYINLLGDRDTTEEERLQCLPILRRNGEHLLCMLDDILDFSKIEAGGLPVEMAPVELETLVHDIESTMHGRAVEKGIGLRLELQGVLPARIRTDATRVRQILMNLLGNAIKFTDRGSVRLVVRMEGPSLSERAPTLRLEVIDTGPGISPEDQARLFRPFSQVTTGAARKPGGTGLGLVICRRLAELLDGEITMQSIPGVGSAFTLLLPVEPMPAEPAAASADLWQPATRVPPPFSAAAPTARPRLAGRVLLAEDTPDNQHLITYYLKRVGLDPDLVVNGQDAFDRATRAAADGTPYDIILMDMQMPIMDGYEATRRLRAHGHRGPIVALTAYGMSTDRAKCLAAGCDDYVAKPIDVAHLIGTLGRYLRAAAPVAQSEPAPATEPAPSDEALFGELAARFTKGLEGRAGAIRTSLDAGDTAALARHMHQLRGTAHSYGFHELGEAAAALEGTLRSTATVVEVAAQVRRVIELCDGIRADA